MLPSNWKVEKVGDLFEVQLGKMLNKKAKEINPQFFYLGNTNVKWGHFELSELKKMHFSESEIAKFSLEPNDILMCEGGEVGRCAIWPGSKERIYYQKALHRLRSKGKIVPQFFQSYMESISGTKILDNSSTKTSISHLTREKLIYLPVKLPPLPEQKKIAQILSTWDKAITTTEQLLANSQQQKKSMMQQLLTGKNRLLDENGIRFSDAWKEFKLDDIFIFKKGRGLSKSDINVDGKNKCVLYGELYTKYPEVINKIESRTNSCDGITSSLGDILMPSSTTTSGIDLANATAIMESGVQLGGDINILRPKRELSSTLIAYLLTHIKKYEIASRAQGITIIHLYSSDIKGIKIKIPTDIKEQQKIAAVLTAADKKITVLQQKMDMLKQEKKALMQQLLTGKRRVKIEKAA